MCSPYTVGLIFLERLRKVGIELSERGGGVPAAPLEFVAYAELRVSR
jgi:hypothetical protein